MSPQLVIAVGQALLAASLLVVLGWLVRSWWLERTERQLAQRKGLYRDLVTGLAARERDLLDPVLRQLSSMRDVEALEALLEEQARAATDRPAWLLDAYDRLGLIDRYVARLRSGRTWRERAFAAELLGRVGNAKAVPALLETAASARSEDADVREIALRALARIGDPRAIPPLIEALTQAEAWLAPRIADILVRHGDRTVDPLLAFLERPLRHPARPWAVSVLGELQAHRAFPLLVRCLTDLDEEVRAKAATALGQLGDRRAVAYLLEHLLGDPAPFVRSRIASALGQFGETDVVDRLVRALGDPAWWVRMRSVEALEQIGAPAEGPLMAALDDADPEIRTRAAVALERLGVPARLVRAIAEGARADEAEGALAKFAASGARELLAEELDHPSAAVRGAVLRALRQAQRRDLAGELARVAAADAEPALRALALETLAALGVRDARDAARAGANDGAPEVRAAAVELLALAGGEEELGTVRALAGDPDARVRVAAARVLPRLGREAALEAFPALLGDPAPAVRRAALESAASARLEPLAPAATALLGDADPDVVRAAVLALGRLGDRDAVPALLHVAQSATVLRAAIADAIARLDPTAIPELMDTFLGLQDVGSRLAVVDALARLQSPAATQMLLGLRGDPSPDVRAAAVTALGSALAPEGLAAAAEALRDPDGGVRARALDAIGQTRPGPAVLETVLELARHDPAPIVRERAALAVGLLAPPAGETVLLAVCHAPQPPNVHAAAILALGAYDRESMVARVAEIADEEAVHATLQTRLQADPQFRRLRDRLPATRRIELRAVAAGSRAEMEAELAGGMRSALEPAERVRLVHGLRALQGERARSVLLQVARSDPSPLVRAAALTAAGGMLDGDEVLAAGRRALGDPSLEVRRVAVELFRKVDPTAGLPVLLQLLHGTDDEPTFRTVAAMADAAFEPFVDQVLALAPDGEEVLTFARIARYMRHPQVPRLARALADSPAPRIRAALGALWTDRPDLADEGGLARLLEDPSVPARRAALRAAAAAGRWSLAADRADDPDPDVRRDVALLLGRSGRHAVPGALLADPEPRVRAAAAVAALAQGALDAIPAGLDRDAAAAAVHEGFDPAELRRAATEAPDLARRRGAALCLALARDPLARTVAERDPDAGLRAAVAAALDGGAAA